MGGMKEENQPVLKPSLSLDAWAPIHVDVMVFDAQSHDDIRQMINYWRETTDFEVHPAVDLASMFRQQGMKVA
jgi:hypothetical protein